MKQILFPLLFLTSFSFGQILVGGDQPKEKVKKEKKEVSQKDTSSFETRVIFGFGAANTFRVLEPNKNELFADSLGNRASETSRIGWSFHLGFQNDLSKFLMWEAGVSFFTNGERNNIQLTDSSHIYDSKYSWIGVPLKLHFKYDVKKVRFNIGAGVIPQMQLKFRQENEYVDRFNASSENQVKTTTGMNNFAISAVGNIGVHYSISKRIGLYLQAEYRHQLSSSYLKTNSYSHKGTAFGANFGMTVGL